MTDLTKEDIKKIIDLSYSFKLQSMGLKSRPPFSVLNPLTYLGALEIHISRIFADILRYEIYNNETNKLRYPLLESFIQRFFKDQKDWRGIEDINVETPKIYVEFGNIDILIKDKQYLIIVENKINGASYQECQPAKYVKKLIYEVPKVLVVLLPKDMGQGENAEKAYIDSKPEWYPTKEKEECPTKEKEDDKIKYYCPGAKSIEEAECYVRALHQNFADWLSKVVEEEKIPEREILLRSNIAILVDYLRNQYRIGRNSKEEMENFEKEKIKKLNEIMGFDEQKDPSIDAILERKLQVDEVCSNLNELQRDLNKLYYVNVKKYFEECYAKIEESSKEDNKNWPWTDLTSWTWMENLHIGVGIVVSPGSILLNFRYFESEQKIQIWIGIDPKNKDKNLIQESVDKVNKVLNDLKMPEIDLRSQGSLMPRFYPFSEAYDQIDALITRLMKLKY